MGRLWVLVCLMVSAFAGAGSPEILHIFHRQSFDGRPVGYITAMAQDTDGVLWLGTEGGLVRYDGSRYRRIPMGDGLGNLGVNSLQAHPRGGLWIGTHSGLIRYQEGRFRLMKTPPAVGGIFVGFLPQDHEGRVWMPLPTCLLRSEGDALVEDPQARGWTFPCFLTFSRRFQAMVSIDGQRDVRVRQADGSWRILFRAPKWLEGPFISVADDPTGTLWCGSGKRLWALPPQGLQFEDRSHLLRGPITAFPIHPGPWGERLQVFTEGGLLGLRGEEEPECLDAERGLPSDALYTAFTDREGSLWLGGDGLYRRSRHTWFHSYAVPLGPAARSIWSLADDPRRGRVWVACNRGVAFQEQGKWAWLPGMEKEAVPRLRLGGDGALWMGPSPRGLWRLGPGESRPRRVPGTERPDLVSFELAPDGRVCLALGQNWIALLDPSRPGQLEKVTMAGLDLVPHAEQVTYDRQGRLWLASSMGVAVLDGGRWTFLGESDGLKMAAVRKVVPAPDGSAWVAYKDPVGISRLTLREGRLRVLEHLDTRQGLPSDVVYDLACDGAGHLWVGTNLGPARWARGGFHGFSMEDGLSALDCNEGSLGLDAQGRLWMGTSRGFSRVSPLGPPLDPERPRALITWVTSAIREWCLSQARPGAIPSREASLTFDFGTTLLADGERATFQVRILGLDETWRDADQHRVRYPAILPGSYVFQVRAARQPGLWGPVASLSFTVQPPWYRTPWAWGLWILAGGGALFLLVRLRIRHLVKARDRMESLVALRTREIEQARGALQEANEALRAQSLTDPLTGLRNRRYLEFTIEEDIGKVLRAHVRGTAFDLAFIMVDLDHFKQVNDVHGHPAGDQVLVHMARLLEATVRETDTVIRWGGEEFLILARDSSRASTMDLVERLREAVASSPFPATRTVTLNLTCSIGFAAFPLARSLPGWLNWHRTLAIADRCLYAVKRSGRNGWAGVLEAHLPENADPFILEDPVSDLVARGLLEVAHSQARPDW